MNPEIQKKLDGVFEARSRRLETESKAAEEASLRRDAFRVKFREIAKNVIIPAVNEFAAHLQTRGIKCEVTQGWPSGTPKSTWQGDYVNLHVESPDHRWRLDPATLYCAPRVSFEAEAEEGVVKAHKNASSINGSPSMDETTRIKLEEITEVKIQEHLTSFVARLLR